MVCGQPLSLVVFSMDRTSLTNLLLFSLSLHPAVFFIPVRISAFHAIFTFCMCWLFGVRLRVFATFLSFFLGFFSIVSPHLCIVPWAVFGVSNPFAGLLLWLLHYVTFAQIDPEIYGSVKISSAYWTGLSIFVGLNAFGAEGVLVGPLLVFIAKVTYTLLQEFAKN